MDKSINDLLCKLKVLSKIQSGQKIMIDDMKILILECDRNRWDRIVKWWFGENRYTMMDKLSGLYIEVKDMINILSENPKKNKYTLERLTNEMIGSMRGLNNLIITYSNDRTTTSALENLSENFKIEINRINKYIKTDVQINSYIDNSNNDESSEKKIFDTDFGPMISNNTTKYDYL